MTRILRLSLALLSLVLAASPAAAHFNMLFPQTAWTKPDEKVRFTYQWGHPFEHELFNAPAPDSLIVLAPDGSKTDLVKMLTQTKVPADDKKEVTAYRFDFEPKTLGDYVFLLQTPAIWMPEDEEFLQDTVKTILHVQGQQGWDRAAGVPFEVVPLTRPYGIRPGMTFQAQALLDGKPLAGALVEIEHYHAAKPKDLPPEEHRTYVAKTDPNGVVTCTLTEPGWWCIAVQHEAGKKQHNDKMYTVRQRAILWVFVDDGTGR